MRTPCAREEEDAELAAVSHTPYALARNRRLANPRENYSSRKEVSRHGSEVDVKEIHQKGCLVPSHYSARPIDREGLGKRRTKKCELMHALS